MNTELVGQEFLHLEETDSTNSALKEMVARQKVPEGFCLYTDYQRSGRGQYGKHWQSEKGQNLLMSLYLRPNFLAPEQAYRLTMSVCLALGDLGQELGLQGVFKWPNDWYLKGKKLAGILSEASIQKGQIQNCIVGIGLNVKQRDFKDLRAASLETAVGTDLDLSLVFEKVCEHLDHRYRQLRLGLWDKQHQEFQQQLMGWNKELEYKVGEELRRGTVIGVEPGGQLLIQFHDGGIGRFQHREIEYLLPKV